MGRGITGQIKAALPAVGWGAVGFVGTSALPGLAGRFVPIPDKASSPVMYYGAKAVSAVATGWLVGLLAGKRAGAYALAGGGINVGSEVLAQFAGPMLGLSEYIDTGIHEYLAPGSMGYLSPGQSVESGPYDLDTPVERLNPDNRF